MRHRGARLVFVAIAVVAGAGLLTGAAQAPGGGAAKPGADARAGTGGWGNAENVPGLAALFKNVYWTAGFKSLSCASPGNCAAGGSYKPTPPGELRRQHTMAFVVSQSNGRWGTAVTVPGITALSTGGNAEVSSVSCARGGCAAVGFYTDAAKHVQGFVTVLRHGRWQRAFEVPGLAALNAGGDAVVSSVSCPLAGVCAAGGSFTDYRGYVQGFVVNERSGRWRPALPVPGLTKLNAGGSAQVIAVRCASAGNCAAGGQYAPSPGTGPEPFVVSEHDAIWSAAIEVPGIQPVATGGQAWLKAVSCPSPGNCAAAGDFFDNNYDGPFLDPWAVSEKNGRWDNAVGLSGGPTGYLGQTRTLSCPSPGNCTMGGWGIGNGETNAPPWLISQHNGTWGTALEIPATAIQGAVNSVSCPSAGNCTAVGSYQSESGAYLPLLLTETRGRWSKPEQVPGILYHGTGAGAVDFVSCPLADKCTAVGSYRGPHYNSRPFVISQVQ